MKKRILNFVLAALMVFSIAQMDVQVYADGTEITATKAADTPYTGKEYIAPCDKTKASETSPDLPSGWEWANPDFELTTEFDETEVIQKDAAGNETNRVTVQVKKEEKADGPAAPTGLIGIAPTTKNGTDGKITGVNDTMEYSTDGGKTWHNVVGDKITGLCSGEVLIRVKETDDTKVGDIARITVPAYRDPGDKSPMTGDNNNLSFWISMFLMSAMLLGILLLVDTRNKRKYTTGE